MTAPRLDATTLAARMNARPLDEHCDGGQWFACPPATCVSRCDGPCGRVITGSHVVCYPCSTETIVLCLPCALADCERAEAAAPVLRCAVCGEDTTHDRASSMYGSVHRHGPTDHPFTPKGE